MRFDHVVVTRVWHRRLGRYVTDRVRGVIHVHRGDALVPGKLPDRADEVRSVGIATNAAEAGETVRIELDAEALKRWFEERAGRPIQVAKVEPGDERVLPEREQRELDALPSPLALRRDR